MPKETKKPKKLKPEFEKIDLTHYTGSDFIPEFKVKVDKKDKDK